MASSFPSFFRHHQQPTRHGLVESAQQAERNGLAKEARNLYQEALDVLTKIMADTLDDQKHRTYHLACGERDALQRKINALSEDLELSKEGP